MTFSNYSECCVHFNCSKGLKQMISDMSAGYNLTVSEFLRLLVIQQYDRVFGLPEEGETYTSPMEYKNLSVKAQEAQSYR